MKISLILFFLSFNITRVLAQEPNSYSIGCPTTASNQSKLWGANGECWDERSRLPDFSFAGFNKTGVSTKPLIPQDISAELLDVYQERAEPCDDLDDSDAIAAAITKAITNNKKGLYFPNILCGASAKLGAYKISKRILLKDLKNFIFLGESINGKMTRFYFEESLFQIDKKNGKTSEEFPFKKYDANDAFFTFSGNNYSNDENKFNNITSNFLRGSKTITQTCGTLGPLNVGDEIYIYNVNANNSAKNKLANITMGLSNNDNTFATQQAWYLDLSDLKTYSIYDSSKVNYQERFNCDNPNDATKKVTKYCKIPTGLKELPESIACNHSDCVFDKPTSGKLFKQIYNPVLKMRNRVVSVNSSCSLNEQQTITLEKAISIDIVPDSNLIFRLGKFNPYSNNLVIKNFEFFMNARETFPHWKEEGFNPLQINNVSNSWFENLVFTNADSGIFVKNSPNNTFKDITFKISSINDSNDYLLPTINFSKKLLIGQKAFTEGITFSSSGHIGILLEGSSDNYLTNLQYLTLFQHDLTLSTGSHGNVINDVDGTNHNVNFDHHGQFPFENLFQNSNVGLGNRVFSSGGTTIPHTGARTTWWNIFFSSQETKLSPRENYSWGVPLNSINKWGPDQLNFVGNNSLVNSNTDRTRWIENSSTFEPLDLHQSQLNWRLTTKPKIPLSNFSAVGGSGKIEFSISAISMSSTITEYKIRYKLKSSTENCSNIIKPSSCTEIIFSSNLGNILNLAPSEYTLIASAKNSSGYGLWSAEIDANVSASITSPGTPTFSATAGNASISITATAPTNNGGSAITGYDAQWKLSTAPSFPTDNTNLISSASTSINFNGLTNGTSYHVRVRSKNIVGNSAWVVGSTAYIPRTVPGTPTFSATAGNTSISITAAAPTNNGGSAITGFDAQWKLSASASYPTDNTNLTSSATTSLNFTGLTNGTSYNVRVRAKNIAGNSNWVASSASYTPIAPTPSSPNVTFGYNSDNNVLGFNLALSTSTINSPSMSKYKISYSISGQNNYSNPIEVTTDGSSSAVYKLTGLLNGSSYDLKITGINSLGAESNSTILTNKLFYGIPNPITNLDFVRVNAGKITVTFSKSNHNGEASIHQGYCVKLYDSNGAVSSIPTPASISNNSCVILSSAISNGVTFDGLNTTTNYTIKVWAVNLTGNTWSAPVAKANVFASYLPTSILINSLSNTGSNLSFNVSANANGSTISNYVAKLTVGKNSATTTTTDNLTANSFNLAASYFRPISLIVDVKNAIGTGSSSVSTTCLISSAHASVAGGANSTIQVTNIAKDKASISFARPGANGGNDSCGIAYHVIIYKKNVDNTHTLHKEIIIPSNLMKDFLTADEVHSAKPLTPGTTYLVKVRSHNGITLSPNPSGVEFTTNP